jgi:hypothetical protein
VPSARPLGADGDRRLAVRAERAIVAGMSTVTEIESALERLPIEAQREVAAWLETRLWPETPAMLAAIDEAERSLTDEGGVPVEEVRQNLRSWITG